MKRIFICSLIAFVMVFTSIQFVSAESNGYQANSNLKSVVTDSNETKAGTKDVTNVPSGAYTVTIKRVKNAFTIKGSIPAKYTADPYYYVFGRLYVDGKEVKDFTGKTSIEKQKISLKQFGTGYHTAFLQLYNASTGELQRLIFKEKRRYNGTTAKPTYKGRFEVYSKKFYFYPYNVAMANQSGPLYMEYKRLKAKKWKRSGKMQANAIKLYDSQGFVIKKLKANKKYKTRIRYGTYVKYAKLTPADFGKTLAEFQKLFNTKKKYIGTGKTYFFGGPSLFTGTKKMGKAKKPRIKSIRVKAINIKFHKHRVKGHYYWTGYSYVWIDPYIEKYYTCKWKVTVRLKKKPGTRGLWINGAYKKGNKKKYTEVFVPAMNYFTKKPPKGQKVKVRIRSYQSKKYKGFSRLYVKTKKVR